MAKCLNAFAKKNYLFANFQCGFCVGLGACDTLVTIINLVQKELDYVKFALWTIISV